MWWKSYPSVKGTLNESCFRIKNAFVLPCKQNGIIALNIEPFTVIKHSFTSVFSKLDIEHIVRVNSDIKWEPVNLKTMDRNFSHCSRDLCFAAIFIDLLDTVVELNFN